MLFRLSRGIHTVEMQEALKVIEKWIQNSLEQDEAFNLLFLDLDNFRQVHERLGSPAAKNQLEDLLKELCQLCVDGEQALWFGGDDFGVLSKRLSAELEALAKSFQQKLSELSLSCTGSIVSFPKFGKNPRELVQAANLFCSEAKLQQKSSILNVMNRG